ncbi:MAG: amidohydrolase family protein [Alphaproteobacteria bacterium]|nr:amidohydrolase family protein [Alphaproteobacteria bacterium]
MRSVLSVLLGLSLAACGVPQELQRHADLPADIVFENTTILDIESGALMAGQYVQVRDGRIIDISSRPVRGVSPDTRTIDAHDAIMMPGLIDMHVHVYDEADLAASLAYGVTTVRNLGGFPFHLPMAERIEAGDLLGPRMISTGAIINDRDGRNVDPLQSLAGSEREVRSIVQEQYQAGFRHLKLYSNVSRENFIAIQDEAARLGMTISGHPVEGSEADPLPFSATLDAGFVTIEHTESIVWHALHDDTDPAGARALALQMAAAGARVTPTLIVHQNLARIVETQGQHLNRPEMASFSPIMQTLQSSTYDFWASYPHDDRTRMQAFYVEMTGLMHRAGVELVVGTDAGVMVTPHGVSVSQEIELLVDAGLTPLEALQAATLIPARALEMEDEIGRIAPGYAADFMLLPRDPQTDLAVLRAPLGVMRNGIWLDADQLAALRDASARPGELRTWRRLVEHVVTR